LKTHNITRCAQQWLEFEPGTSSAHNYNLNNTSANSTLDWVWAETMDDRGRCRHCELHNQLRVKQPRNRGSFPGKGKRFFSSLKRPDGKAAKAWNWQLHLEPTFWMSIIIVTMPHLSQKLKSLTDKLFAGLWTRDSLLVRVVSRQTPPLPPSEVRYASVYDAAADDDDDDPEPLPSTNSTFVSVTSSWCWLVQIQSSVGENVNVNMSISEWLPRQSSLNLKIKKKL
jgi:hypothetical protein